MDVNTYNWHWLQFRVALIGIELLISLRTNKDRRRRKARGSWSRPWLVRRPQYGLYEKLLSELEQDSVKDFTNFLRIDVELWHEMLARVGPKIEKKVTFMRKPLEPGLRLAITLRFLATGDSYMSLMYSFRVASNTVCGIIQETCVAIVEAFMEEVVKCPRTADDWKSVASEYSRLWNFENCIGAIDGKHVAIRKPPNGGSLYYNYKGFHSIVLMAIVDARYRFLYIDVGANGQCSDGGVFKECELFKAFDGEYAAVPEATPLPNDNEPVPYSLVGDDAFGMRTWLMKPFSRRLMTNDERIFNYRLSRARRVVENTFGILAQRFRCLKTTLQQIPDHVDNIVMACCVLHNLILIRRPMALNVDREDPVTHHVIPGTWRDEETLTGLRSMPGNTTIKKAKLQREYLKRYYNSPAGSVPWQEDMI